ncbi:MAG: metallophosphoesterase [Clostridia bacterium]|nr:metallophosphoesterase [Clostridia bacterium]
MKTAKKIIAVLLACITLFAGLSVMAFAQGGTQLKFNSDGQFKIMIFADNQDNEDIEETTTQIMTEALAKYTPDLVVFLGDNTVSASYETHYTAIEALLAPTIKAGVPFALVFGNHDQEGVNGDKEALLEMYQEIGGELCLTTDAAPEIYGCGNSNVTIFSSDGKNTAFNLWFFDTGSTLVLEDGSRDGYDYIREDQVKWYEETETALKAANGGKTVPSIVFQHIIVPDVYKAIYSVELPFETDGYTYEGVTYLPVPSFSKYNGIIIEPCSPSYYNKAGQFDAWVEHGDVIAMFCGHDHQNDFQTVYQGIGINNVSTVGGSAYHDDISRGVGLVTLDESDLSTYEYEMIYMFDLALEEGSQISEVEGGRSKFYYRVVKWFRKFINGVHWVITLGKAT